MNTHITKLALVFVFFLLAAKQNANARTRIFNSNFGSQPAINPSGWIFTGVNLNISTNNPSYGYPGASGNANLSEGGQGSFTNTMGVVMQGVQIGTSTATLLVSTLNYSNIRLSFGMRRSSSEVKKNISYNLEWSADGVSYFPIEFKLSSSTNWNQATGKALTLPLSAENQPTLFLRWTFVRTGFFTNIKIDDFKLRGDTLCTPSVIIVQPVNSPPVCALSGETEFNIMANGSGTLNYQWQKDSLNITDNSLYDGSNTSKLKITNPPYSFNGNLYRCVITNCSGYTVISKLAELNVKTLKTDINKDGATNNTDFILLIQQFNSLCNACPEDITGDGMVNIEDFLKLLVEYGRTCQ